MSVSDTYRLRCRFANEENPKGAEVPLRNSCHVGQLSTFALSPRIDHITGMIWYSLFRKLFRYTFSYVPVRALVCVCVCVCVCVAKPRNLPRVSVSKFYHTNLL
jgi:hypothetical protein